MKLIVDSNFSEIFFLPFQEMRPQADRVRAALAGRRGTGDLYRRVGLCNALHSGTCIHMSN